MSQSLSCNPMKCISLLILVSVFSNSLRGQDKDAVQHKILYSALRLGDADKETKKLPQYEAKECLFNLLDDIVEKDENCSREIGYYFSCVRVEEKILLNISPVDLNRIPYGEFFGYFIYGRRNFLCYGNIRCYVSKKPIDNPLLLLTSVFMYPQVSDLYLGGDTNGVLKVFDCQGGQQYALVKTCISPAEQKARHKERR